MLEVGVRVVLPLSYAVEIEMLIFSPLLGTLVASEDVTEKVSRRYANKRLARSKLQLLFP